MTIKTLRINELQVRANRLDLLSRLADDLAHEVKSPLNAMVINLELLRGRVSRGDKDGAMGRLELLAGDVQRLHELVDRILRLFRPARDDPGVTELDHALAEVVPLVERQVRLARSDWQYQPAGPGVRAAIRPTALVQVLLNLAATALESAGGRGGRVGLAIEVDGDAVALRIHGSRNDPGAAARAGRDGAHSGGGAAAPAAPAEPAAEDRSRPGSKGSERGARIDRAAGGYDSTLGLDVCRSLAEEAGGSLVVEPSSEGSGWAAVLQLPRSRNA